MWVYGLDRAGLEEGSCWALWNVVIKFRVPLNFGNFFTGVELVSL